jgi:2-dehydropantoate 2-reductase
VRLLVVGAGSTGGYFGGRLANTGRDVTFLVRPARAAQLEAYGLQVISPHGGFTLAPKLIRAGSIDAPFNAVLLAVKAYSLEVALDDFAPAVGPETIILPVLNGIKHVDTLQARFGEKTVVGSVCKVAATLDDQGRIVQLTRGHELAYGEISGASSARIQQIDSFMQGAGFDARVSGAIEREMWEKWVVLASLSGITCLMRGSIGNVEAAPGGTDFAVRFVDEVISAVRGVGHPLSEDFLAKTKALLTEHRSSMTSSLYRDLQNGSPIEADQIIGDLLARAQSVGVATPLLAAAYTHLCVYQLRCQDTSYCEKFSVRAGAV